MPCAALYARYSDDMQRRTSIEDQLRRARDTALARGFECPDGLVFTDAAITGKQEATSKRSGYQALLHAWEARAFDALVVDELSRLARGHLELAHILQRIQDSGVRFISAEGIDSGNPGWELSFGITGAVAAHFLEQTRFRVIRGMLGQLERGYMCAAPPFGYRGVREGDEQSGGTRWEVVEADAAWVLRIYAMRLEGCALGAIARELNVAGVRCPRKPRTGQHAYWRPATVRQLIANPVYKGLFVWNGSAYTRAKYKKKHRVPPEIREFARPALRIVDDATWNACNRGAVSRTGRGGGKYWFAGLVSCGTCGATLTANASGAVPTVYCAQCSQARRVGVEGRVAVYVSTRGLREALLHALRRVLSPPAHELFRARLRERLVNGNTQEVKRHEELVKRLKRSSERLLELLSDVCDDEMLAAQYRQVASERKSAERELEELRQGEVRLDRTAVEQQLAIEPLELLEALFDGSLPAARVRALLSRLFPKIVLLGRSSRFVIRYRLQVAPGVLLAHAAGTSVIDGHVEELLLEVSTGALRPVRWQVIEVLEDNQASA